MNKKNILALLLICLAALLAIIAAELILKERNGQDRKQVVAQQKESDEQERDNRAAEEVQGEKEQPMGTEPTETESAEKEVAETQPTESQPAEAENTQTQLSEAEKMQTDELQKEETVKGTNGVSEHGALHFDGTTLKGASGENVVLKGVSTHGLLWYYEYVNAAAFKTMQDYGANAIRLAMYVNDPSGGYVQNRELSTKLMYMGIENAKSLDMYVVADWHILNEKDPNNDVEVAKEFFREITSRYGDDPAIIYEICNEPNGDVTWDRIANYANQVIPVIREKAPSSIIVVGTPNYSFNPDSVIGNPLNYPNVAYSFHQYSGQHAPEYPNIIEACLNNNIPVWVSEWGINTDMGGDDAKVKAEAFIDYMDEKNLSRFAWALSNKDECFSIIKADCKKLSGWSMDDFTEPGKVIINGLK